MNHAAPSSPRFWMPLLTAINLGACDEWPRHANVSRQGSDAVPAGTDAADLTQIEWANLGQESEPNDAPQTAIDMNVGHGWRMNGVLDGTGWNSDENPPPLNDCTSISAFPPTQPGRYSADVDWLTLSTDEDATLCVGIGLDNPDISFDFTVYLIDDCGQPSRVFVDANTDAALGLNRTGGRVQHGLQIQAGSTIGLALAGYQPESLNTTVRWTMDGALVALIPGSGDDLCPRDLGAM